MLFSIHALDKPDIRGQRARPCMPRTSRISRTAKDFGVTITVGGPLVADDGKSSIGSLIVIEAPDRATAEKFNRADPFFKNGIWAKVEIQRFDRKQ